MLNEVGVLQYAVEFGPGAVVYCALVIVSLILARRRTPWWLRFQGWLRAMGPTPASLFLVPWYLAFCFLCAFGAFLVPLVTGKPAPFSVGYWLIMGVCMAAVAALFSALFKKRQEPEDWLLWDKEAENR